MQRRTNERPLNSLRISNWPKKFAGMNADQMDAYFRSL